jgi:hypothetical protein
MSVRNLPLSISGFMTTLSILGRVDVRTRNISSDRSVARAILQYLAIKGRELGVRVVDNLN